MSDIPKKIELGCGNEKPPGFFGVDIAKTEAVDYVQDFNESDWELPSNHFEIIRAIDVFEHIRNPTIFMEEIWRIATGDSKIIIRGPHFSSNNWHDPTHVRLLGSRTFEHYSTDTRFEFYCDSSFEVVDFEIQFQWQNFPIYKQIGHYFANKHTNLYEKTGLRNLLPATNIEFELKPVK